MASSKQLTRKLVDEQCSQLRQEPTAADTPQRTPQSEILSTILDISLLLLEQSPATTQS
jgi:hypothetical protein